MNNPPPDDSTAAARTMIAEVRYSLPQLLTELKAERATGAFAMEKLDQHEIGKLFKLKGARRGKSAK